MGGTLTNGMAKDLRFEFRIGMLGFGASIAWFGAKGLFSGRFLIEDFQRPGGGSFPGQTYVDLQGQRATLVSAIVLVVGLSFIALAFCLPLLRNDDEERKPALKMKHHRSGKRSKAKRH